MGVDFLSIAVFQEHRNQVKFNIVCGGLGSEVEMRRKDRKERLQRVTKKFCYNG